MEQEIYNLLPFLLSCIVFPREYFRDTRALPLFRASFPLSKGLAAIKMAAGWNSCGTIISGRWSCGTRCTRKHPPDQLDRITGPYPGTGSIFQLNIPAMYIWRIACFRLVLAFTLKCYKSTVEFRLKAIGV